MPLMVKLELDPAFKPKSEQDKALVAAVKAKGPIEVDTVTAQENIRLSGGLYRIAQEKAVRTVEPLDLDSMSADQLKLLLLQVGVTPQKQMKRDEVIKSIRLKLEAVDILEEE